jgi:transcriptional regulator of arginine metabolism
MSFPMADTAGKTRLDALRELLEEETLSTQEELRDKVEKLGFDVTQSTISRDLRKLAAVRAIDSFGRTVYRLPQDESAPLIAPGSLQDLVTEIVTNGSIIVIHTTPGSASLVARHLDHHRPGGILGTIAGDDTIFVAPKSLTQIRAAIREIEASLGA